LLLNALLRTVRYEIAGEGPLRELQRRGQPVIFVLWHGRLLPLSYLHRGEGVVALVSRSDDGEYITGILEGWGYRTARGSSSRGGSVALRSIIREARDRRSICITPDGPRGPRHRMKVGALIAAQVTGLPLIPVAAGADPSWSLGSWDRFQVPRPFSRVRVRYGAPIEIPREADPVELERCSRRLEDELNRLTQTVDGGEPVG